MVLVLPCPPSTAPRCCPALPERRCRRGTPHLRARHSPRPGIFLLATGPSLAAAPARPSVRPCAGYSIYDCSPTSPRLILLSTLCTCGIIIIYGIMHCLAPLSLLSVFTAHDGSASARCWPWREETVTTANQIHHLPRQHCF